MNTKLFVLLACFLLIICAGWYVLASQKKEAATEAGVRPLFLGEKEFLVEVADTPSKRQQGLSGRTQIGSDGVLFIFPNEEKHGFWMKDMLFDLDFIWIKDGRIVEITKNVPKPDGPGRDLPTYFPSQPIDSMLEVVAGFSDREDIKVGDSVK